MICGGVTDKNTVGSQMIFLSLLRLRFPMFFEAFKNMSDEVMRIRLRFVLRFQRAFSFTIVHIQLMSQM